jgi:actin-related protein
VHVCCGDSEFEASHGRAGGAGSDAGHSSDSSLIWSGGAKLFLQMQEEKSELFITRAEFDEKGPSIVAEKCF